MRLRKRDGIWYTDDNKKYMSQIPKGVYFRNICEIHLNENLELHSVNDNPAVRSSDGRREWYKNGKLHRDYDLPAIEESDFLAWYQEGKLHRENGPARIWTNLGYQMWFNHGKLHRLDGPAIITKGNIYEYWIDNKRYTEEEYESEAILNLRASLADKLTKGIFS